MKKNILKVNNLKKSFGKNEILKGISFELDEGQVTTIIGPSGSGKSTLLRCLNLLERADGGEILYEGDNILNNDFKTSDFKGNVAMVFQNFNLFNNMNVLDNCIKAPMKVLNIDRKTAKAKAIHNLELVGMGDF